MGARLCNYLSHNLTVSPQSGNFQQLLLQRCQMEYENRDEAAKGDETTQKQFHAFVFFLAELYLNLEMKFSGMSDATLTEVFLKLTNLLLFSDYQEKYQELLERICFQIMKKMEQIYRDLEIKNF
ncbi:hypothetical protein AV530_014611 [Patagioenas fasciata monilis]|uniref:MIF4G domain-containing protein n=1 Tax=Patagioenas fasciata monilis TaxID=372326 RepID=A0A1V4L2H8_PATFA|nr:hypothetical protein AV530_014611 [Patagioenas fasciata monilis]